MVKYDSEIITRIKELMSDEDYYEVADNRRDKEIISIIFHHKNKGFSCIVKPYDDPAYVTFELVYSINPGAFTLTSNECGSLFNISHFRQQERYMINLIRRLRCLQI